MLQNIFPCEKKSAIFVLLFKKKALSLKRLESKQTNPYASELDVELTDWLWRNLLCLILRIRTILNSLDCFGRGYISHKLTNVT